MSRTLRIVAGPFIFTARMEEQAAPLTCAAFSQIMPYRQKLIHARWSGESCWSPLGSRWPLGELLPPEQAIAYPSPGQILLFGGGISEPELLIAYGPRRFASRAGPLAGNPVLTIEKGLSRLTELGRQILWCGAVSLRLEHLALGSCTTNRLAPSNERTGDGSIHLQGR